MITAGKLIELLKDFDPELPVMLSRDQEGNGFSPLDELGQSRFCIDGYSIETGIDELTEELEEDGFSEEDVIDGPKCIVLWPGYPDDELRELVAKEPAND